MSKKLAINGGKKLVPEGLEKTWPIITQDDIDAVEKVLRRGILWGPDAPEKVALEKEWAEYCGVKYCLAASTGTSALHACVAGVGIEPGDEVIMPAFTFWATAQAVLCQNAIPIFVDIDPVTYNIDPKKIEEKITDKTKAIIEASLEQYLALGQYFWAGHTYAQMVSFAAVVGREEFAYDCLLHFIEYWVRPNGLHFNRDTRNTGTTGYHGQDLQFTMEANCAVSAGISDMLVQGWNNVVRIFPAVPAHWRDLAFRDLLTEGAFHVSAIRRDGRTVWVKIVAGVARKLRLRNPFGNATVNIVGARKVREGNMFVAALKKGQEVIIHIDGESVNFEEAAMLVRQSDTL